MINDLYLVYFGQSAMRTGKDDTFSVVTMVDRSGAAKIQNVLEYPADRKLLTDFNSMLIRPLPPWLSRMDAPSMPVWS